MERKLNSSKKTASKKPGILTRPINPDFLKNAVQKNDGIEIKTNQPLLPLAQNNDSTNRNAFEMEFQSDKEGGVSLRNFLESKKKERISPTKSIAHVSNDIEYVQKSLKASAKKMKTPSQENSNQKNMNNKEYSEIMEKMNQIIIVIFNKIIRVNNL